MSVGVDELIAASVEEALAQREAEFAVRLTELEERRQAELEERAKESAPKLAEAEAAFATRMTESAAKLAEAEAAFAKRMTESAAKRDSALEAPAVRRRACLTLMRRSARPMLCVFGPRFSGFLVQMWGGRPVLVDILHQNDCSWEIRWEPRGLCLV